MDNDNFRPISNDESASSLGITPEQLNRFQNILRDNPVSLSPQIYTPVFTPPQIDPKSTPGYKLQQIVEQGEKQITELKTANERLGSQIVLLEQQRDLAKEQKAMFETKYESEKAEKEQAIKENKKNKVWGIIGKILSGIVGLIAFATTVLTAVYPENSKELFSLIWSILFPGN
jgi:hypothetical protein